MSICLVVFQCLSRCVPEPSSTHLDNRHIWSNLVSNWRQQGLFVCLSVIRIRADGGKVMEGTPIWIRTEIQHMTYVVLTGQLVDMRFRSQLFHFPDWSLPVCGVNEFWSSRVSCTALWKICNQCDADDFCTDDHSFLHQHSIHYF